MRMDKDNEIDVDGDLMTTTDDATTMEEAEEMTSPVVPDSATAGATVDGDGDADGRPTAKKSRWKRPLVIIPVALLLVLTMTLVVLAQPAEPEPDLVPNPHSASLYFLLADAGIVDAVVDIQEEYVLVRYNVPPEADPETILYLVLGTTYGAGVGVDTVILQVYVGYEPVEQITVQMRDLALFAEGHIDQPTFESTWQRT